MPWRVKVTLDEDNEIVMEEEFPTRTEAEAFAGTLNFEEFGEDIQKSEIFYQKEIPAYARVRSEELRY
ncbi:MAG: hypothetical protein DRP09_10415 [Candidatus Thorarchaeota archaeon]|nr:MAG: hypothetical protein DRP09_10415 [Candidatus Thorarchaeota archaeon]